MTQKPFIFSFYIYIFVSSTLIVYFTPKNHSSFFLLEFLFFFLFFFCHYWYVLISYNEKKKPNRFAVSFDEVRTQTFIQLGKNNTYTNIFRCTIALTQRTTMRKNIRDWTKWINDFFFLFISSRKIKKHLGCFPRETILHVIFIVIIIVIGEMITLFRSCTTLCTSLEEKQLETNHSKEIHTFLTGVDVFDKIGISSSSLSCKRWRKFNWMIRLRDEHLRLVLVVWLLF